MIKIKKIEKKYSGAINHDLEACGSDHILDQFEWILREFSGSPEMITTILEAFPFLISMVKNPSSELKDTLSECEALRYADNLTEFEMKDLIESASVYIEEETGRNHELISNMINTEIALDWLEAGTLSISDLDTYKDCSWYGDAVRLYKLGNV